MKAALYALHYVHSTYDYGITFTSSVTSPIYSYIHFPAPSDVEAYTDAIPPSPTNCAPFTAYSDACWGSQLGSAVRDGTLLPLFKFWSMSSGVVFRQGGPLSWMAIHQDQTALSSGEAEIAPQTTQPNQSWECITWPRASNPVVMTFWTW